MLIDQGLSDEMQRSYLAYAMSVIVSRALPDVRDGLKPVARRILYSMWRQGLRSSAKFRKSAHVVGDVMARYHPHGDMSIYDALARMVQYFSLRYELIDGQGNWGSVDGDAPAAMRYTEARLSRIADEILIDIEKETADFINNYDSTRLEPTVLPGRLPQFLVNGTVGIAVGMATSVPPHNLTEVCDASIYLIEHPEATVEELMHFVKGPDFPTGGAIYDRKEIQACYATGKGSVVTRAITNIEEAKAGHRILVKELPYMVNKATLITKIAEAVKEKRLDGIRDLRDESDKEGIRMVLELKKDAYPKKVLNRLFAITDLQKTFHVNMLALTDHGRQPKVLTLKDVLQAHIAHRQEVITRRTRFDLKRALERAHILEGLKKALDSITEVIATIKKSKTRELAHTNLRREFGMSDPQATAILEMRLQTLAGLERQKISDELEEKRRLIKELESILQSPKKVLAIIKHDYQTMKSSYGDERRTKVFVGPVGEFSQEDLVPDEPTVVVLTRDGYIKRLAITTYQVQGRGGKGVRGKLAREDDAVDIFMATTTHKMLLFFTNLGRVFATQAFEIPEMSRMSRGQALQNFLELGSAERVTAVQAFSGKDPASALPASPAGRAPAGKLSKYLIMATRNGVIKKTEMEAFSNIRRSGLKAITLKSDDALEWVAPSNGDDFVLMISTAGQAIQFSEHDVRPMGRTAGGVRGMRLKKNDAIVAMHVAPKDTADLQALVVTECGFGKRTPLGDYRLQGRGGSGIKTAAVTAKTGKVVNAAMVQTGTLDKTDLLIITKKGQVIRIPAATVNEQGRSTQGVRVMRPTPESGPVATFTTWISA